MIKKIIIASIMSLYLCTPHIKANDTELILTQPQETHLEEKEKSAHAYDQRFINFLIAFCVDLAFTLYQTSSMPDPLITDNLIS